MTYSGPFPYADLLLQSMPDETFVRFLRVCLLADRESAEGLLQEGVLDGLLQRRSVARRLLPAFSCGLHAAGLSADSRTAALLNTAVLWEKTRAHRIELILTETLGLLYKAGLEPVVVGGLACARLAYSPEFPRHCHDIDIAVEPGVLDRADTILGMADYAGDPRSAGRLRTLQHSSGIAVRLHTTNGSASQRALPAKPYRIPDVVDVLTMLLIHSARSCKLNDWAWIADATLLTRVCPDRQLLRERLLSEAEAKRSGLAIGYRLQWLARAGFIEADVALISRLRTIAERETLTVVAPFLRAACSASGQSGRELYRRSGPRSRVALVFLAASNGIRNVFS